MGRFDRWSANPQMRAHRVPKWGYGPISGCVWLTYSALNLVTSVIYLFLHDHWRAMLDRWIDFSAPIVAWVARFVPAVDSFEGKLLLLSRFRPALSREAEIPVLRNIVAMNGLLFAIFAAFIVVIAPIEARTAVRRYGTRIVENAESVLENPTDYGLQPYATDPMQRWLMKSTGVHAKEAAIIAFALAILTLCYYGFDFVAVYSFIPGFGFGLFATSGLYWVGETMVFGIFFFVPAFTLSHFARNGLVR